MFATLRIHHDGTQVYEEVVHSQAEVLNLLDEFRPPAARGSVATLSATGFATATWLSGHSITGPRWNRQV